MRSLADHLQSDKSPHLLLLATLFTSDQTLTLSAFIDSGCEKNLIDSNLVQQLRIETVPLERPLRVAAMMEKDYTKSLIRPSH